ncbi:retrovirus-related Pol polyprotein from transposon 297 [Trichonephila clavata]|uniref:RNA-directed DNA polymerase n=1 Tax=Trichonephila clavata TaxID=2740835 RepID=A0A8X6K8Q2_TRICU|nr:retrovirus-related Pol polyprotein from transposon 297 [Trichonephila clavata]
MYIGLAEPLDEGHFCVISDTSHTPDMKHEMSYGNKRQENLLTDCSLMISPELNDEQKSLLSELLRTFSGIFTKTDKSATTGTNVKHRIHTGNHAPINQRAYQGSPTERRIIRNEVQKILEKAREFKVLGHLVSGNGVRPDPDKVKAVSSFPIPKNVHDIRRNPVEEESETTDKFLAVATSMNLAIEHKKDLELARMNCSNNCSPIEKKTFELVYGILCKKIFDPDGKMWLPVIPKHLRADILTHFHDEPTAGHIGFAKTYDRIRNRFYWPGMHRNVVRYVMHCRECQWRTSVPQRPPGRLIPIPPAIASFHRIGIDLLGRFPKSTLGKKNGS